MSFVSVPTKKTQEAKPENAQEYSYFDLKLSFSGNFDDLKQSFWNKLINNTDIQKFKTFIIVFEWSKSRLDNLLQNKTQYFKSSRVNIP